MNDEIQVLKIVASASTRPASPYMVTGSMAMNYYAQPRVTRDIDVVVAIEPRDAERLAALFASDFLCEVDAVLS